MMREETRLAEDSILVQNSVDWRIRWFAEL